MDSSSVDDYAQEAVSALNEAGILEGDDNGNFNPQSVTTRAEAVTIIMNAQSYLSSDDISKDFELNEPDSAASQDDAAEAIKMISSMGCKPFAALDVDNAEIITEGEFVIYVAAAIGLVPSVDEAESIDKKETTELEQAAMALGLYPTDYKSERALNINTATEICLKAANYYEYAANINRTQASMADDLQLYKNVKSQSNGAITYGDAFILIKNLLRADYMKYDYDGKTYKKLDDGETVLSYYRDIYYLDDIMNANHYTSLTSANGGIIEGQVKIGTEIYNAEEKYHSLIGYNVTAYYSKDDFDTRTLLYAVPYKNNKVINIDAADIDSLKDGYLNYYVNNTNKKRYKLDKSISFIYNGVAYNDYMSEDCKPASGYVTLIDNNNDGSYDVVSVTSYDYMFVDSINSIDGLIVENEGRVFDVNNDDITSRFWRLDKNDNYYEVKIYDFCTGVPVRIQQSKDGELISFCEIDYIKGTITSAGSDSISIDGVSYEASEQLYGKVTPRINYQGVFVKDSNDRIVYFYQKTDSTAYRYGYLMNIYRYEDGETIGLKLYDQGDEFRSFIINNKVKMDSKMSTSEAVYNQLTDVDNNVLKQLIRYSLDTDGKLNAVDTFSEFDFKEEAYRDAEDSADMLTKYYSSDYIYKNDYNVHCFTDTTMGFNVGGDSIVFIIGDDQDAPDDDNYNIGIDYLDNGTKYKLDAYDIDRGGCAGAAVCYVSNASSTVNVSVNSAIVTEVIETVNSDGEEVYEVTYYLNSAYRTAYIEDNISPYKATGNLIAPGDVIRVVVNDRDVVTQLAIDFDYETGKGNGDSATYFNNEFAYLSYTWSSLYSYRNNYLLVSNTKDAEGNYNYTANVLQNYCLNSAKIIIYDTYSRSARAATISELRDYVTYGDKADTMLVRKCYYAPWLVIVYR